MTNRLNKIVEYISQLEDVVITKDFVLDGLTVKGDIKIKVEEVELDFSVVIYQQYPYQLHDTESITFINNKLIEYNHVNRDGSICVHTHQSQELKTKIEFDFYALKCWIKKYYINKDEDVHYEHIVIPSKTLDGYNYYFLFTEVDYMFKPGQFGLINYFPLSEGFDKSDKAYTNLIVSFNVDSRIVTCNWNERYSNNKGSLGCFLFLSDPPVHHKRFAVENWKDLDLVQDDEARKLAQGQFGVLQTSPVRHRFQVEEGDLLPLREGPREGGLPALARAQQRRDRRAPDGCVEVGQEGWTLEHESG